jgi:hypothetical protein
MVMNYIRIKNKWLYIVAPLLVSAGLFSDLSAQYRQNYGLLKPLSDNLLPHSRGAIDKPVSVPKIKVSTDPIQLETGHYLLNQGWELASDEMVTLGMGSPLGIDYNTANWYNATVPGTVLTTLVNQGVYPDPYIGLNNMSIPDSLCRQIWWYRLQFNSPSITPDKRAWLHFDGINYRANFYLNGKKVGRLDGAFKRAAFDVTSVLNTKGSNILLVQIIPPSNPGIPHEQSLLSGMGPNGGQLALDGPTFISSEGWDWVPGIRDRNIGIWQDVRLKITGNLTLGDPQIITNLPLPDTTTAILTVKTSVKNHHSVTQSVRVDLRINDILLQKNVTVLPGEELSIDFTSTEFPALRIKNPKLWWPNGYGEQNLYIASLSVADRSGIQSDERKTRFGIREISYELMADAPAKKNWRFLYNPTDLSSTVPLLDNQARREYDKRIFIPSLRKGVDTKQLITLSDSINPYLVIRVNGVRIFCRGGNWGMDDGMKRVSKERLEPFFALHKQANFTMIRNWTGESTQSSFYELADEYGLLVWNDFWISTEGYNLNPLDQELFLQNSLDAIKRFRNHPSIAIWCPRNEGYAPIGIEDELYTQLMKEDGTRHYIGNSREINLRQSGDWHFIPDMSLYFTKYAEGFSTEIGTFSVPTATTIRKFIKPEDHWPINDAWHYHDLHSNNQNLQGYLKTVDSLYGPSNNLDDFSRKVQLVNYESHRAIFEGWNNKLWQNGSGVLLWMSHPAWPSMIWQTYSWDAETHGSYFGSKKACEPVHIQLNRHDNKVVVVNTTTSLWTDIKASYVIYDLTGKRIAAKAVTVQLLPNSRQELPFESFLNSISVNAYLVRLTLADQQGKTFSVNDYWRNGVGAKDLTCFNDLPTIELSARLITTGSNNQSWKIANKTKTPAIGVKLNLLDGAGQTILPAHFSEGYFTLLPGEEKVITVQFSTNNLPVSLRSEGYNCQEQQHRIK